MGTWKENLSKVKEGKATKLEFTDAITHWLGTDVASNTEGMWEAISRRVVWIFPDGYALAVGTYFNPVLYKLSEKIDENTPVPLPQSQREAWTYTPQANGWSLHKFGREFPTAEAILELVETLTKYLGVPSVLLPWGYYWTESVTDQGEDYYEWYAEEDSEEDNDRETMFHLAQMIQDETIVNNSPWELTHSSDESDGLSEHSDFMKFQRFINRLENEKVAVVDLDQHCAGCSSGVYEYAVKADPELEGKEIFRTWGQNSEYLWLGDGSIYVETYINDEEAEKIIKQIAEEEGLDMDLSDEDWEPTGSFYYES